MKNIYLKSPAKINLSLDITGTQPDGYHNLNMIVQTINLFDYINISKNNSKKINLSHSGLFMPDDSSNIMYKAVKKFFEAVNVPFRGVDIYVKKYIPSKAGLGGGSSNAAYTLMGLNTLFNTNLSKSQLQNIGSTLGADVPLFFHTGTLQCQGKGEIITPLAGLPRMYFVIAKPFFGFSTAATYKKFDSIKIKKRPNNNQIIDGINNADIKQITDNMYNVLEEVVNNKVITQIKSSLISHGALTANMTGSGSAVFGVFKDKYTALCSFYKLKNFYPYVFLAKPIKTK